MEQKCANYKSEQGGVSTIEAVKPTPVIEQWTYVTSAKPKVEVNARG